MARKSAFKVEGSFLDKLKSEFKKGFNTKYRIYRTKWKYAPKLKYVLKFPTHVDIESTNTCNLKCSMCPHSKPTKEFQKSLGFMDMELYKKIIDQGIKNGMCSIKLNWRGEPLMHPKIAEMVQYAKEKGVLEVQMNTNGLLLNPELSEKLIDAKLDRMIFSVDGIKKETYEKIRVQGNYETLLDNIKTFVKIRNEKGLKKPLVRMQMVKMDCNINELEEFKSYWKPIVDEITTQNYTSRNEGETKFKGDSKIKGRLPCPQIWQRIVVSWGGKVIMCCRDWESENPIGKLDETTTLKDIWKGKIITEIRKLHKQKRLDKIPICKKCSFCESYNWV